MENEINELVSDITILGLKEKFDKESWENEIEPQILREETKMYVNFLLKKAKPETALREAFFAGDSIFKRNIFKELIPEQTIESHGFIDYSFEVNDRPFFLELKTFFVRDRNKFYSQ